MTRWIITLLGALVASFAAHAQELMPPTATPNVPQIKSLRLKTADPIASKYQFRLGDGKNSSSVCGREYAPLHKAGRSAN